ncbi:MAG TPA: endonuclease MutS2 [Candidatus Binataceae bacterium]|nr:endonuclease MutS2 [Candidatus Binataceae bacterium]
MRDRDLRALEFDKVLNLVAAHAASESGREATLRLRPAIAPAEVRERLRATAEMVELRAHTGSLPMQSFADQRGLLLAASRSGAVLDGASLLLIRDFVLAARHVAGFMRSRVERMPHLAGLHQNLLAPKELADALLGALADDATILDDASPELRRLRRRLRDERRELETRLARSLTAGGMEPFVSDFVVTVRNRRFVLPLKLNYAERLEGIVQDRSVSGETLFVEPMWAVELNNRVMMLEREAEAEEHRILAALTAMTGGYARELELTFAAMVELDALNARAIFAERSGSIEPEIVADGLDFTDARHPLLVNSGREVVPIDVSIAPGQHGLVISGPNTGGKTVALKTIGLLSLMAQTGLLIPSRAGSKAMVFRSVFADIGDEQSIEANLSSFSGHIANLSEIIRSLDEPALVILDEPGAGTDPAEGAALAIGLMNHLEGRRCMVAIATHSTAVKLHAYSRAGFDAAAVDFDPERLTPLYRLKPHTIGRSYGLAVARRLGLPDEIIRAAEAAMGAGNVELDQALGRLEAERTRIREEAERSRAHQQDLERELRDARAETERARAKAEAERVRSRAAVSELIDGLRREGSELMREIKERSKSRSDLGRFIAEVSARLETAAPAGEAERPPLDNEPLRPGEQVELGEIRAELLSIDSERAVIVRGGLKIEVSPERLRRARKAISSAYDAARETARKEPRHGVTVSADAGEHAELNLIGMRSGDALRKLEEFLDQAFLTNRAEVRIVHGIGSGALRKAIQEYLGTSPYCASFTTADPHHGGAGATLVRMNL